MVNDGEWIFFFSAQRNQNDRDPKLLLPEPSDGEKAKLFSYESYKF